MTSNAPSDAEILAALMAAPNEAWDRLWAIADALSAEADQVAWQYPERGEPTGTALTVSKIMPYVVAAFLIGWTNLYGSRPSAGASNWPPPPSSASSPAGPPNCRMWPLNRPL